MSTHTISLNSEEQIALEELLEVVVEKQGYDEESPIYTVWQKLQDASDLSFE
jgi:hypothetical protein